MALLLFGSGVASLVYQTVWLRELRNVFGASTPAAAAVIGIFMGGLGLGGLKLGHLVDRHANPLLLYAKLEGAIAAAALLTVPIVRVVETVYFASGGSPALGVVGATLLRLVLTTVMLGVPTFLMGGTLPAAARAVLVREDVRRRAVATLYGVNTLGAVVGTVGSTFFALEELGNRRTLLLAVLLNVLVAVAALALSRLSGFEAAPDPGESGVPGRAERGGEQGKPAAERDPRGLFTLTAAAVAGFSFLLLELVWYRMLAPILGGSTFTFGLILATALLGIGLGGLFYGMLPGDRPGSLGLFSSTCGLQALAIVAPFALGDRLSIFSALLRSLDTLGFAGSVIGWSIVCGVVVLPAAIVSGFQLPALIALSGSGSANAGRDVGRVCAFNTLGAIAGSLAGGFGLMPLLTAPGCWKLAAWLMVALAAAAAVLSRPVWLGPAAAATAALLLVQATGPTAVWRHSPIGAGRVSLVGKSRNEMKDWAIEQRGAIVAEWEGVESSIAVNGIDGYAFLVNGKSDGNAVADAPTQVMGGLIGAILHPRPRRSLVIGLGTGSTAGWLGKVPGMERVDVAEIEPAIRDVAALCAPANQDVLTQPSVKVFYGDAREMLLVTGNRYDVIFSEPSNPFRAGIASLFTRELYQAAAARLAEGGVFLQWVQAYEIDGLAVQTILRTLRGVFPHVSVWQTLEKDMVLVASPAPLPVDVERVRARVAEEPYRTALNVAWGVDSAEGFLAHLVADGAFASHVADNTMAAVNTDDRNTVEFGVARSIGRASGQSVAEIRAVAARLSMRDGSFQGTFDPALVRRYRTTSRLIAGTDPQEDPDLSRVVSAYRRGRFADAARLWRQLDLTATSHPETLIAAESFAQTGDEACLSLLPDLARYDPVEALLVEGIFRRAVGQNDQAADAFARGFSGLRAWPWADADLLGRSVGVAAGLARWAPSPARVEALLTALSRPFALHRIEATRRRLIVDVARRVEGCGPRVLEALALMEPHVRLDLDLLTLRADCYRLKGHPLAGLAKRERDELVRAGTGSFESTLGGHGP